MRRKPGTGARDDGAVRGKPGRGGGGNDTVRGKPGADGTADGGRPGRGGGAAGGRRTGGERAGERQGKGRSAKPEPVSVVGRIAERDAERRAMERHRFWRRAGRAGGGAAAALVVGWAVFFSPLLALDPQAVTVSGAGTTVDVGEVRSEIRPEHGVPLPRLDTVALRERVLELNGVKDVRIMRDWPRGLSVGLTSREPVVAVPDDGRFVLLDAEAVRVGETGRPGKVPVVDVPLSDDTGARAALFAALDVMAALPDSLAGDVSTVVADTQDNVRTRLAGGAVVIWGSGDRLELKTRVVTTLREARPGASVYDVSSPDLPVTR